MKYNFEGRINRVINNHQFTCQHRSHYLFVLKGFEPILDTISLNVERLDGKKLSLNTNFWITYEEGFELSNDDWNAIKDHEYDVWIVDFNFFENSYFALNKNTSHEVINHFDNILWVNYKPLEWVLERKTIHIFNTLNPLIGIIKDFDKYQTNEARLKLLEELIKK